MRFLVHPRSLSLAAIFLLFASCDISTNFGELPGLSRAIATSSTGNPIVKNIFTADPAAMVYNGTVYLYTGHDEAAAGQNTYVMKDWRCFSSTDMINWVDRGSPLAVSAFSWASGDAWASQVIYRNGKFYWYICAENKNIPGKAIGVAVSSSPTGPFVDAIGTPLITNNMTTQTSISWDDIDPTVFIDDDGQAYLYWGNTVLKYAKLKSNMIELDGGITAVTSGLNSFTEAPWLHKRNGIYYLSYASGWPEQIVYSTSSSPTGPWTYRGVIMTTSPTSGTNHQAIIDYNGKSYFIYHTGALPTGGDYRRSVSIEPFVYNADGTIPAIAQSSTGVAGISKRLQSYNFPSNYVRHQNFDIRVDSGVTPASDAKLQIVPGLANSSGYVSFQAANYPGYYLRHYNFDFVLAKNDGTAIFAQDATFKEVPGLADSTWSSFTSYNYPTRYIRHSNFLLKLTTIGTTLDQQDATFKAVD